MPDKVTRTHIRTHAALDTGAPALMSDALKRHGPALYQVMLFAEHEDIARSFADDRRLYLPVVGKELPHHRTSHDYRVAVRSKLRISDAVDDARTDRDPQHDRRLYFARHGKKFVGDGKVFERIRYAEHRADIVDHRADIERQAALGHGTAGDELYHRLLVPGGIERGHRAYLYPLSGLGGGRLQRADLILVLRLERDDGAARPKMERDRLGRGYYPLRIRSAEIFIRLDQRLALGGVDDEIFRLRRELDVRREAGASRSHHSCGFDFLN